jgi:hypothetical protein
MLGRFESDSSPCRIWSELLTGWFYCYDASDASWNRIYTRRHGNHRRTTGRWCPGGCRCFDWLDAEWNCTVRIRDRRGSWIYIGAHRDAERRWRLGCNSDRNIRRGSRCAGSQRDVGEPGTPMLLVASGRCIFRRRVPHSNPLRHVFKAGMSSDHAARGRILRLPELE